MSIQRWKKRFDLEDRARSMYVTVPFERPRGAESFEVLIEYDPTDGARIDVGCEGPAGWRGWSGGARRRFVIGREEATWGYLPGEVEPGQWNIVLGLHVVPAAGVDVEVVISFPGGPVLADPQAEPPILRGERGRSDLPAPPGLRWFACDFHAHSLHSDGSQSIGQLARRAAGEGLDVLAVTDHNTVSHHAHLAAEGARHGVTLVPGQEVTTARGHANVFGEVAWVDFRRHPREWVRAVADEGGILSINHPVSGDCSWQWPLPVRPTHAEILHSSWLARRDDTSIWSWWNAWGGAIPLGGSDFHYPESGLRPGTPTTWVAAADASVEAIMDGMRQGRVALSTGPREPVILRVETDLIVRGAAGLVLCDHEGRRRAIRDDRTVVPADTHLRYHLETDRRHVVALVGNAAEGAATSV